MSCRLGSAQEQQTRLAREGFAQHPDQKLSILFKWCQPYWSDHIPEELVFTREPFKTKEGKSWTVWNVSTLFTLRFYVFLHPTSVSCSAEIIVIFCVCYRGPGHQWDGDSVVDHPVVVGQSSHVWVGPSAGVEVRLGRESCSYGLQVSLNCADLRRHKHTTSYESRKNWPDQRLRV